MLAWHVTLYINKLCYIFQLCQVGWKRGYGEIAQGTEPRSDPRSADGGGPEAFRPRWLFRCGDRQDRRRRTGHDRRGLSSLRQQEGAVRRGGGGSGGRDTCNGRFGYIR